jgi:hypothetical protein
MSTTEATKDIITFRVRDPDKGMLFFVKPNSNPNYVPTMQPGYHSAQPIDVDDVETVVRLYQRLVKEYGADHVEIIRLQVLVRETPMDIIERDEFMEERRKVALAKLQSDDIEALGLQKLATYNKLRYHNLDENIKLP